MEEKPQNGGHTKLNNPAARVHEVLARAKSIRSSTIIEGYLGTFGLNKEQFGELFRLLGLLDKEAEEVARLLKDLNETSQFDFYMESLPSIKNCLLIQHFGAPWEQFKTSIRAEDLKTLRFCSDTLSKKHPEKTASAEELSAILDKVNSLYDQIATSSIEANLRSLMLDQLESIRRAVHEYRVRGIEGLRQAVADSAFIIAGNEDRFQNARKIYNETHGGDNATADSILNDPITGYMSLISSLITVVAFEWKLIGMIAPTIHHLLSK
jgi:hypothetical protein